MTKYVKKCIKRPNPSDYGCPKYRITAYLVFRREHINHVEKQLQTEKAQATIHFQRKGLSDAYVSHAKVMTLIAAMWNALPIEEQMKYYDIATLARKEGEKNFQRWKTTDKYTQYLEAKHRHEEQKKKKMEGRKDIEGAPKKPPRGGFFTFSNDKEMRGKLDLQFNFQAMPSRDVARALGKVWKAMPREQRQMYEDRAKKSQEEYELKRLQWLESRKMLEAEMTKEKEGDEDGNHMKDDRIANKVIPVSGPSAIRPRKTKKEIRGKEKVDLSSSEDESEASGEDGSSEGKSGSDEFSDEDSVGECSSAESGSDLSDDMHTDDSLSGEEDFINSEESQTEDECASISTLGEKSREECPSTRTVGVKGYGTKRRRTQMKESASTRTVGVKRYSKRRRLTEVECLSTSKVGVKGCAKRRAPTKVEECASTRTVGVKRCAKRRAPTKVEECLSTSTVGVKSRAKRRGATEVEECPSTITVGAKGHSQKISAAKAEERPSTSKVGVKRCAKRRGATKVEETYVRNSALKQEESDGKQQ